MSINPGAADPDVASPDAAGPDAGAPDPEPIFAEGHHALARWLHGRGRLEEAVAAWDRAIALQPDFADAAHARSSAREELAQAHLERGIAHMVAGRSDEARSAFEDALRARPGFAAAHFNLGVALLRLGRPDEAFAEHRAATRADPGLAEAHASLGGFLHGTGAADEAVAAYHRALALHPSHGVALLNLALLRSGQGDRDGALALACRGARMEPARAEAFARVGDQLLPRQALEAAARAYRVALALEPGSARIWINLGYARQAQGATEAAAACIRRAAAMRQADAPIAGSNLAYLELFRPDVTPQRVLAAHRAWDVAYAAPLAAGWRTHPNARDPDRRLVVGIVSGDLRDHPAGRFAVRGVEALPAHGLDLIVYANQNEEDGITARFRAAAQRWRAIDGRTDAEVADGIRDDGVDVLIDLTGHNARARPLVFARRPAPVQIAWAGYMTTTGLRAMDALIADRHHVPPGAEGHYVERVLRMPDAFIAWDPPAAAPEPGPPPCLESGTVTFGAFNILTKLNDRVLAVWAAVLERVPDSRLVVKTLALSCPETAAVWRARLAAAGVADERLVFAGATCTIGHMAATAGVDVALDPFPFSGSTTTLETLWMGVPVITLPGDTFAARHSLAFQTAAGFDGMAAADTEHYVALAAAWAGDRDRLAAFRRDARARIAASPLCDGSRFARHFADLLRQEWRRWCAEGP